MEAHARAGGDAEGFVEVVGGAAREEGAREVIEPTCTPDEVNSGIQMIM